jgi:TRAP-type mannitol/chloroaromatic compound transport system substrate-binding protein
LPELYQEVIKLAAYQANIEMLARYDALNGQALQRLVDAGAQLRTFSTEIMQAAEEVSFTIFDEFSQSDADFPAIFEPWNAFRENIQSWHSLIETSYNAYIAGRQ